ncbi:MAG: hypothetical protein J6S41_04795 [Clostridia bacterium]|nr:hypothetical protein [Clostridia bacterium]
MLLDIERRKLPTIAEIAAYSRSLSALTEIVNESAQIHSYTKEETERVLLAFDIIAGGMQELSAALDMLDDFAPPTDYGFRTDPAEQ